MGKEYDLHYPASHPEHMPAAKEAPQAAMANVGDLAQAPKEVYSTASWSIVLATPQ